jgi:hypothetical protein
MRPEEEIKNGSTPGTVTTEAPADPDRGCAGLPNPN